MKKYLVIFLVFQITFKYLLKSYFSQKLIVELKKEWALEILNLLGYKLTIQGASPPTDKPLLLVGNHISFLDILVVVAAYPHCTFLAKKEVQYIPIVGSGAKRVGTFFVDRESKENRAQKRKEIGQRLYTDNLKIVVFPSGTTTLHEELPWKKGIFEIALEGKLKAYSFKIAYNPKRESAFVDDDTMLGQLAKVIPMTNKKVTFQWLGQHEIVNPAETAEVIRQEVIGCKLNV